MLKNPNQLLITPHIAWASIEARKRLLDGIIKNIEDFLR
jgi:glycerate dehydrogenase